MVDSVRQFDLNPVHIIEDAQHSQRQDGSVLRLAVVQNGEACSNVAVLVVF